MGYTIIAKKTWQQAIIFCLFVASLSLAVFIFFPYSKKILTAYSIGYYTYHPTHDIKVLVDTSKLPPAMAVPVLMYHGVINSLDDNNTTIPNFIAAMEMLKENGYQTITIAQYDLFRQGKFILPPRPIIITFDDGRKDSYYTTDDVFNKLGFKATIFEASGPTIDGNSFYLTFDELRQMKATGRWDIQAHGRYSHKKIPLVKNPTSDLDYGRYLTSKIYLTKLNRIETTAEFEKRVEDDYLNSLSDLKTQFGITSPYFAIPLNDYGQQPISNYDKAVAFNQYIIQKYFRMAFIQANDSDNVQHFVLPVYNYRNQNPYRIKRIEMKNMRAEILKSILEKETSQPAQLTVSGDQFSPTTYNIDTLVGIVSSTANGLFLEATSSNQNGQILFGKTYWYNYTVTTKVQRLAGRSVVLLFDYLDSQNYMAFGITDNGYFLRSTVEGVTQDIAPNVTIQDVASTFTSPLELKATIKDGIANCYANGQHIFTNVKMPLDSGEAGIKVWSNNEKAKALLQMIDVNPL